MNLKLNLLALFCALQLIVLSQPGGLKNSGSVSVSNANAGIATSYTMSACGLNYEQSSLQLSQRSFTTVSLPGVPQPAAFTISNIPACAPIVKAFLYVGTQGTGGSISATLINPAGTGSVFPMTIIGQDVSACWGTGNTYNYRADVTALISGSGNYTISGIPTAAALWPGTTDANGATLFIIYRDPSQNYTGNIVIADGSNVRAAGLGGGGQSSIGGFNICGTPTLTSHFMILNDLEQMNNTDIWFNSTFTNSANYIKPSGTDQVWDFVSDPGAPLLAGQTSISYGFDSGTDCAGMMMAGAYYQSGCLTCSSTPSGPVTLTVSAVTNPTCLATASVNVSGGSGNYSYAWTISGQSAIVATGSVEIGLSPNIYAITVTDYNNTCVSGNTATLQVIPTLLTLTPTVDPGCPSTATVMVTGSSSTYSYTWSGSASTASVATGLSAGVHTITARTDCAVGSTIVIAPVTLTLTPVIDPGCSRSASVSAIGAPGPFTYTWTGPTQTGSVAALLTAGVHTVSTTNGCFSGSAVFTITPTTLTLTPVASPTCGATATINVAGSNGTTTYNWTGAGSNLTSSVAIALSAGVHTVTVTNDCAATGTETILITPDPMTLTATSNPTCGGNATVVATGGSGANTYSWSPAGNNLTSAVATALAPGVHTVAVRNNCAAGSTTILITPGPMTLNAVSIPTCGASASVAVTGGSGANSYTWSGTGTNLNTNTPRALSAGVHTVIVKNNCAAGTTTLLITPDPMTLTATSNPVCGSMASVVATGGSGTNTYSWTGLGTGLTSTLATVLSAGVHTVSAFNNCAAGSATISITPIPLTVNVLTPTTNVCPLNVTVTTNTVSGMGSTYTYTWASPSASFQSTGNATTTASSANLGNYTYTITTRDNLYKCGTGTATVAVTAPAATISLTSPTTICVGDNVALVAGSPTTSTFSWSPAAFLNVSNANTVIVVSQTLSTVVYTLDYRTSAGCANTQTTQVTMSNTVPLNAVNVTLCEELPLFVAPTLTNATYSYNWQGPNSYASAAQNLSFAATSSTQSGVYTLTISTASGCKMIAPYNVTVFPSPTPTVGSNSPICAGRTLSLTSTGGGMFYNWAGPNSFVGSVTNPLVPNATTAYSGNYTLSITYTNNCIKQATLPVVVNPLPQPVIISNSPVCETNTLQLDATGGGTYQWVGPNGFNSSSPTNSLSNVSAAASGVYTVITALGTCTAAATATVLVNPQPVINPTSNSPVCQQGVIQLNSGVANAVYLWTGPNSFTSNLQNPTISPAQFIQSGNYTLTASGITGNCPSTTSVISVSVLSSPNISATGATLCMGAAATVTAGGASSFTWTGPSGFSALGASVVIPNVSGSGIYTVAGTNVNPCIGTTTVYVLARSLPTVSATGATVCEGQSSILGAFGATGYNWSGPSGFTSNVANVMFQSTSLQNAGTYTVVGTAANSCTNSATSTLSVIAVPQLSIAASPAAICIGHSATITVSGAQTYSWLPLGSSNATVLVVSPGISSVYNLIASNGLCNASAAITVTVSACTGIEEFGGETHSLQVYPNPNSGSFTIKTNEPAAFRLINALGQEIALIKVNEENNYQASVPDLAEGVYYLVTTKGYKLSQKIIVQRP